MTSDLDPLALELLQDAGWITRLAIHLAEDLGEAEELAQSTYAEILGSKTSDVQHPRAWIAGLMQNVLRRKRTLEARQAAIWRTAPKLPDVPTPEEVLAQGEMRKIIINATMGLPEPYGSTVLMHYHQGVPLVDIARREGVPAVTIRSRLRRGLELLRGELGRKCGPGWQASCMALAGSFLKQGSRSGAASASGGGLGIPIASAVAILTLTLGGWWLFSEPDLQPGVVPGAASEGADDAMASAVLEFDGQEVTRSRGRTPGDQGAAGDGLRDRRPDRRCRYRGGGRWQEHGCRR